MTHGQNKGGACEAPRAQIEGGTHSQDCASVF